MSDIFFSGISSGVDWDSIIQKIIEVERIPQNNIKIEVGALNLQKSFWSDLNVKLFDLQFSINNLRRIGGDVFNEKIVDIADTTIINAYINDRNTPESSYNINVIQLATTAIKTGDKLYTGPDSVDMPARAISSSNMNSSGNTINPSNSLLLESSNYDITPESSGEIVINGVNITWTNSDSLNDIIAKINSSAANVTAAFDSVSQKLTIVSNDSGSSASFTISENSGNFLEFTKISAGTYAGTDAETFDPTITLSDPDINLDIPVTRGVFSINGVMFYVDPDTDTLNDVLNKINSSSAGVIATFDSTTQKINIVQNESGENNKIILGSPDDTSNFLYAMKLSSNNPPRGGVSDTYSGKNAIISVNGGSNEERESNYIDDLIPGVSIELKSTGETSISVMSDKNEIKNAISDFVEKFNDVISTIDEKLQEEKVKNPKSDEEKFQGSLRNNSILIDLKDSLINMVINEADINQNLKLLSQVGIEIKVENNYESIRLDFDENKFSEELNSDFDAVKNLFYDTAGFGNTMYSILSNFTSVNGPIYSEQNSLDEMIKIDNERITNYEERIKETEERLRKQFWQMESIVSSLRNQMSWLYSMSANLKSK